MAWFGEISPLGQTFKSILQTFEGLFSVWQSFEPTLAQIFMNFGQIWAFVSCQIMKNILAVWSHWRRWPEGVKICQNFHFPATRRIRKGKKRFRKRKNEFIGSIWSGKVWRRMTLSTLKDYFKSHLYCTDLVPWYCVGRRYW